jgi:hypothetical protein
MRSHDSNSRYSPGGCLAAIATWLHRVKNGALPSREFRSRGHETLVLRLCRTVYAPHVGGTKCRRNADKSEESTFSAR